WRRARPAPGDRARWWCCDWRRNRASCRWARAGRAADRRRPRSAAPDAARRRRRPARARAPQYKWRRGRRTVLWRASALLLLPAAVVLLHPAAADDAARVLVVPGAPHVVERARLRVGPALLHPAPQLLARVVRPLDERQRLRAIGRSLARVVRLDEQRLLRLADAVLRQERVDAIGVGALGVVDERGRRDAERLQLLGRQRRRTRRHGGARQLALELGV